MSILLDKNIYLIEPPLCSSLGTIKGQHTNYPAVGAALADCYLAATSYLPCEISNRLAGFFLWLALILVKHMGAIVRRSASRRILTQS